MPPIPYPLGAFECGSIFDIYQPYLEAILTKVHVSIIITSKILISFAVLGKISMWKGGLANISTPYTFNFSYLIILLYIYIYIYIFFKSFSTGLVRLYIAGLPLRSCPDPWATFCAGGPPMSDFRFWQ